ncbi:hypothetical protein AEAC466_02895 [Asticcacaulis sp. AC466]|uniref:hypothetical protein n=1 Tax=Asticcacaulis sp. AC466 TaxID=1282362 RepID=UPI0003C3E6EC|nr:hypothetical protein [Asticcacaulis sp. AC466]ESQ86156.1 hypothetical protein AEAC466_02895 [Asticcacaulis sp. AC466]
MENAHAHPGSSLNIAVDRLDRALEALESRVRALQAGEPLPEYASDGTGGANEAYDRVLAELEEARISNAQLAQAANAAHEALGAAAANIRQLLASEAA